jgi:hypothetical protein
VFSVQFNRLYVNGLLQIAVQIANKFAYNILNRTFVTIKHGGFSSVG